MAELRTIAGCFVTFVVSFICRSTIYIIPSNSFDVYIQFLLSLKID